MHDLRYAYRLQADDLSFYSGYVCSGKDHYRCIWVRERLHIYSYPLATITDRPMMKEYNAILAADSLLAIISHNVTSPLQGLIHSSSK